MRRLGIQLDLRWAGILILWPVRCRGEAVLGIQEIRLRIRIGLIFLHLTIDSLLHLKVRSSWARGFGDLVAFVHRIHPFCGILSRSNKRAAFGTREDFKLSGTKQCNLQCLDIMSNSRQTIELNEDLQWDE